MGVNHVASIHLPEPPVVGRRLRRHISRALVVAAALGLLFVGQAMAQEAETDAAPAPATPGPGKDGKVCQYEDVTGSRMKKRVCDTPERWAARERAAKDMVRELDRKSPGGPRQE